VQEVLVEHEIDSIFRAESIEEVLDHEVPL
jgi:hypothetical protein